MLEQIGSRTELFIVDDDDMVRNALAACSRMKVFMSPSSRKARRSSSRRARGRRHASFSTYTCRDGPASTSCRRSIRGASERPSLSSPRRATSRCVSAIKLGAADFIVEPFDLEAVTLRVRQAIEEWQRTPHEGTGKYGRESSRSSTSSRPASSEVLAQIASGASNKEAGRRLGISRARSRCIAPASWRSSAPERR